VNTWKVILATMVIFATGVFTGVAIDRRTTPAPALHPSANTNKAENQAANRVIPSLLAQRANLIRNAQRQLDLDPEQRVRIEQIMRDSQLRMKPIVDKISPDLREEFRFTTMAIRQVLSPEQRKQFDELMKPRNRERIEGQGKRREPRSEGMTNAGPEKLD
jgi:Spy/CpxP family protein refolding chaperone